MKVNGLKSNSDNYLEHYWIRNPDDQELEQKWPPILKIVRRPLLTKSLILVIQSYWSVFLLVMSERVIYKNLRILLSEEGGLVFEWKHRLFNWK